MHWAAHGKTAAEKIYYSADADTIFLFISKKSANRFIEKKQTR